MTGKVFIPLSTTHPDLASQARGWDPSEYSRGSDKKVSWQCEHGHEWQAVISSRVSGRGCPICAGKRVQAGYNDLATTDPELACEADGWDPSTVIRGSHQKLGWVCFLGHKWRAEVKSRALIGAGCPYCDGKLAVTGVNDLKTLFPDIAAQADGWDPAHVKPTSHERRSFVCELGHKYSQAVRRRVEATGCPVCQNDQILVGFNDLATTHPQIAAEADGWNPKSVVAGTPKRMPWKCSRGHKWTTGIQNRTARGTGCPLCSGRRAIEGETDILSTHPELAAQLLEEDPRSIKAGTNKKVLWRCGKGHEWRATPANRTVSGTGCPYCSGKKVLAGENDLATTHPGLASQASGWDPTKFSHGSDKKVSWQCDRGHEWQAVISSRATGIGCPICSGRKLLSGFNDLATTHPLLALEADGWNPREFGSGSKTVQWWHCAEGHRYKSRIDHRTYMGSGCPSCAQTGFDPREPAWIYFLEHDELAMFQIGISNKPEQRLQKHRKADWSVLEVRGPMDGYLVQALETSMLKAVEQRGAQLGHKAGINKFDGYSEAWMKSSLVVTSIRQILDWVYEDEGRRGA